MEVRRRITTMFRKRNLPYNVGLLCEESSRCIMPLYRQDNRAIKFAMWISSNDKNIHDRLLKFALIQCTYIYIYISLVSSKSSTTVKEEGKEKNIRPRFFLPTSRCSFDEIVGVVSARCSKDRKSGIRDTLAIYTGTNLIAFWVSQGRARKEKSPWRLRPTSSVVGGSATESNG